MNGVVEHLVSTIIPVYNRAEQLREAVASVLAQDYRPIEIIIVDDGSTDGTGAAADALQREAPDSVRAVQQPNGGPGLAREHGRRLARGGYIQYLDSDDILLPGKFATQVAALAGAPDCDVAYGWTRYRFADGTIAPGPWKQSGVRRSAMFPSFLVERWWDTPTPLYRRGICDRAGPWTDLRLEEDWEYDCRIAALGARLVCCEEYVCEVRDHGGQRLCRGTSHDRDRLTQRARSHRLIFAHARQARLPTDLPEMQHFARALFLLARQCGAAGLATESKRLFQLAKQASGTRRGRGRDFQLYELGASIAGWRALGKLSCWLDRARPLG